MDCFLDSTILSLRIVLLLRKNVLALIPNKCQTFPSVKPSHELLQCIHLSLSELPQGYLVRPCSLTIYFQYIHALLSILLGKVFSTMDLVSGHYSEISFLNLSKMVVRLGENFISCTSSCIKSMIVRISSIPFETSCTHTKI